MRTRPPRGQRCRRLRGEHRAASISLVTSQDRCQGSGKATLAEVAVGAQRVILTDDEAAAVEAEVLEFTGDAAKVRAHWSRPRRHL